MSRCKNQSVTLTCSNPRPVCPRVLKAPKQSGEGERLLIGPAEFDTLHEKHLLISGGVLKYQQEDQNNSSPFSHSVRRCFSFVSPENARGRFCPTPDPDFQPLLSAPAATRGSQQSVSRGFLNSRLAISLTRHIHQSSVCPRVRGFFFSSSSPSC